MFDEVKHYLEGREMDEVKCYLEVDLMGLFVRCCKQEEEKKV